MFNPGNMFKELKGKRILIEKPMRPESQVILTPEAEDEIDKQMLEKYNKLHVVAVGTEVEGVKTGDFVYVGKGLQHSEIIEIDNKFYFLVSETAVAIIW